MLFTNHVAAAVKSFCLITSLLFPLRTLSAQTTDAAILGVAHDSLQANLGRIATRNGASAPWNSRVDLRLARAFHIYRAQSIELTVDVFNFLNLLNSDWGGQYLLPTGISTQNPVLQRIPLLNVVGFDQVTQRYRYTVNQNFGVLQKQGDPFTIQLGGRYIF